jgi:hypothetical protein
VPIPGFLHAPIHNRLYEISSNSEERFPGQQNDEHNEGTSPKAIEGQHAGYGCLQSNPDFRFIRNHCLLTSLPQGECPECFPSWVPGDFAGFDQAPKTGQPVVNSSRHWVSLAGLWLLSQALAG